MSKYIHWYYLFHSSPSDIDNHINFYLLPTYYKSVFIYYNFKKSIFVPVNQVYMYININIWFLIRFINIYTAFIDKCCVFIYNIISDLSIYLQISSNCIYTYFINSKNYKYLNWVELYIKCHPDTSL